MNQTKQRFAMNVIAFKAAEDAIIWDLVAKNSYHRSDPYDSNQSWFWTRTRLTGEVEPNVAIAGVQTTTHALTYEYFAARDRSATVVDTQ